VTPAYKHAEAVLVSAAKQRREVRVLRVIGTENRNSDDPTRYSVQMMKIVSNIDQNLVFSTSMA
jgi:hypothetical protein